MSWIAVTETPCPNAAVEVSTRVQERTGLRSPGDSPGRSIPVREPKPKRVMYSWNFSLPSLSETLTEPMLLEYFRMSEKVRRPCFWRFA
jgi:hypothetical protein